MKLFSDILLHEVSIYEQIKSRANHISEKDFVIDLITGNEFIFCHILVIYLISRQFL